MDYGAELAACCTTISDAMVDSRCVEVSQAGNEAACEAERSNLEDGGTC
jgi:hypothetical protein